MSVLSAELEPGKHGVLVSPQERRDAVCFAVFSLNYSIYCITYTVQQSRLEKHALCIESFPFSSSNDLFKQFLADTSLCLTWGANGRAENNGPGRFDATECHLYECQRCKEVYPYPWWSFAQ